MRSRSLHHPGDWNRFSLSRAKAGLFRLGDAGVNLESSEDAENDTVTGSAEQVPGADFRTHIPQGQVAIDAADGRGRSHDLGALRHGPGVHGPLVFRAPVPLPDAFLLAVRQRRMRAGFEHAGPVDPGGPADHPVRVRVAGVRARLPADVLLLPGGVLPGVLARAVRVRGARAARHVLRRDQVPADRAEHTPLLLVRGPVRRHPAHLRRGGGVPRPGRELRVRHRVADPAGQRDLYLGLHAGLPHVPAHHGRPAEELLQAPGPVLGLDEGLLAERAALAVRLDLAGHADAERPVHSPAGQRGLLRSENLQLTERASGMTSEIDRLSYDVVVIGAGGSGLRAAIEARLNGKKTAIISKSLF